MAELANMYHRPMTFRTHFASVKSYLSGLEKHIAIS